MDSILTSPHLIWIVIGLVLMLLEFVVPGFVIIFFGAGGVLTGLLAWIIPGLPGWAQLMIFLISSVGSLLLFRKFMPGESVNEEEVSDVKTCFIGDTAMVTQSIDPYAGGKIELNGVTWGATSDEAIPAGLKVVIVARKGLSFVVKSQNGRPQMPDEAGESANK